MGRPCEQGRYDKLNKGDEETYNRQKRDIAFRSYLLLFFWREEGRGGQRVKDSLPLPLPGFSLAIVEQRSAET